MAQKLILGTTLYWDDGLLGAVCLCENEKQFRKFIKKQTGEKKIKNNPKFTVHRGFGACEEVIESGRLELIAVCEPILIVDYCNDDGEKYSFALANFSGSFGK